MAAELKARLTLNNTQFLRSLRGSLASGRQFGQQLASTGFRAARAGMVGLTAATAVAGGALAVGVKRAYDLGGSLSDLAARTRISAGRLQIMQRAFEDNGLAADDVGMAVDRMQRFLGSVRERSKGALSTMTTLGLRLEDIKELSPDEQFRRIGLAIDDIKDPTDRVNAAMDIFGRSGGRMLTLFADRGGLATAGRVLGRQAEILDKRSGQFDEISDKLARSGVKLQGFFVGVAASLAGTIGPLLDRFEKMDFASLGERFGASLLTAADTLLGAFKNPEAALGTFGAYAKGIMAEVGNRLMQNIAGALEFFKAGGLDTVTGIGNLLLGQLMIAFTRPIAYFQAGIGRGIEMLRNAGNIATLETQKRELPLQEKLAAAARKAGLTGIADHKDSVVAEIKARIAELETGLEGGMSIEDRVAAIMAQGGPRIRMGRRDLTGEELVARGSSQLKAGLGRGYKAATAVKGKDVFGSAAFFADAEKQRLALQESGAGVRQAASAPAAPRMPRDSGEAQLYNIVGRQRFREIMQERDAKGSASPAAQSKTAEKTLTVQEQVLTTLKQLTTSMETAFAGGE